MTVAMSLLSPVQAQSEQRITADAPSHQHDDATQDARRSARQWIALHRAQDDRPGRSSRAGVSPVSGHCDQPTVTDRRGDNRRLDVVSSTLTSDCSDWTITTTFARPIDRSRLGVWWLDLDHDGAVGKGCNGATFMMLAFVEHGRLAGYVLHTPSCRVNAWTTWALATVDQPDSRTLRTTITGSSFRQGPGLRWRTGADATGPGGTDVAPNTGWVRFVEPPPTVGMPPLKISFNPFDSSTTVDWDISTTRMVTFDMTLSENSGPPEPVEIPRTASGSHTLFGLTPDSTYEVTVRALVRGVVVDTESARFTVPEAAP